MEGVEWQVLPPTLRPKSEDPWVVLPADGPEWLVLSTTNRQGIYYRAPGGGPPYPWLAGVRATEVVGHGTISLYEISRSADVQRGLAELYRRHGLEDEEVASLRRALAISQFDAESRKRLVAIYHRRGELARADSTVLGGQNPDVPLLLEWTMIRRQLGDDARTKLAFEQSLKGFPSDPELKNAYAWFLQEIDDELDYALQMANDAVKWSPDDPAFLDTRGMVRLKRRETKEALEDFAAALKAPGGDVAAIRWHRVLALAQAGRRADALAEARAVQQREDLDESLRAEVETWLLPH